MIIKFLSHGIGAVPPSSALYRGTCFEAGIYILTIWCCLLCLCSGCFAQQRVKPGAIVSPTLRAAENRSVIKQPSIFVLSSWCFLCLFSNVECIKLLQSSGADFQKKDKCGRYVIRTLRLRGSMKGVERGHWGGCDMQVALGGAHPGGNPAL